ncbi:ATP-binding cassette sub- G member 2 [Bulinus truncatus]|nr:ATP-binding cassette sub- G member 2 [Bulinus truncatus]
MVRSVLNKQRLNFSRLADRGRNIIFSIHQPRYSIYRLFDTLMMLSHGDVAYHGKASEALDYFASIGYICEEHNNPPDFFLDVINGDSTAVSSTLAAQNGNGIVGDTNQTQKTQTKIILLGDLFRNSKWFTAVQNELKPIMDTHIRDVSSGVAFKLMKVEYKTNFMVHHENVSGFYRVSAYFVAKVFCDVIPLRMIPAAIFSCIVYFMLALSFAISSTVRIFALANLCLALSYVFMMLFSGLLINVGDLGDWISWIKYLSIFRYSLNALQINELKGLKFCSANGTDCMLGDVYLERQKIPYETQWDLWQNEAALGIIIAVFLTLAYIQLRRIKNSSRTRVGDVDHLCCCSSELFLKFQLRPNIYS